MYKKIYLGILFSLISILIHSQSMNLGWVKSIGGTFSDNAQAVTSDAFGNVYVTGNFSGTVDFDPSSSVYNLTSTGSIDVFIQKFDANGNFLWAKSNEGISTARGRAIKVDNAGNVYVTGYFRNTVDFDPVDTSTFNLTSNGSDDIFIQKLDANGDFVWAKSIGTTTQEQGFSLDLDNVNNVIVAGIFIGTVDFDPGTSTFNMTANGGRDGFVLKLDNSGNFMWAKSMGGFGNDETHFSKTDNEGNIYTTGFYRHTVDFDPGTSTFNLISGGQSDIFVQKLDSNGNFIWAKSMGGSSIDKGESLAIDQRGNIYLSGSFRSNANFDPGNTNINRSSMGSDDAFVQKLDSNGNFVWVRSIGGFAPESGYSIDVDTSGNLFVAGTYHFSIDFDPGPATFNLASNGQTDCFILQLDTNGVFVWADSKGGISTDFCFSIDVGLDGYIYTSGSYSKTADFNPDLTTHNLTSNNGGSDGFVQKIGPCAPKYRTDNFIVCGSFTWIDGITYGASNNSATYAITTSTGCDSIIFLNLIVGTGSNTGTDVVSACNSLTWIDGVTYTTSNNTAKDTLVNSGGCDSIVTLNLTITNSTSGTDIITACNSYTWIDGVTYTASNNTAKDTLINSGGCDSIVTLNLTINNSTFSTDVITACNSYTWMNGVTYTASNTTATHTLVNADGCDSVVTLNLTINNTTFHTDNITACDSYTWINGVTYTASNNTARDTLINANGCDSIITLDLTINVVDIGTTVINSGIKANATGVNYQWLDCDQNFTVLNGEIAQEFIVLDSGIFAVEVTQNGCIDTSTCIAITLTIGIEEDILFQNVSTFPNPSKGPVNIELGNLTDVSIQVFDLRGVLVYQKEGVNDSVFHFELTSTPGIYILELSAQGEKKQYKLIKQ